MGMFHRTAGEVASDLLLEEDQSEQIAPAHHNSNMPVIVTAALCLAVGGYQAFLNKAATAGIIIPMVVLTALAILVNERLKVKNKQGKEDAINYFLPIVMERLVMAAEVGLDVIPALKTIVALEHQMAVLSPGHVIDPITILFEQVVNHCEAGMSFEDALEKVSSNQQAMSLKHAFIHLGIAFKEGGELIGPLKELSDATQLHYQEGVEEEIARLPVKATLPLVLTFAGLMTFFLAAPLVQIITSLAKAVPK